MDRGIVYPGPIPLDTDVLGPQRFAMYGIARLCEALLGTGTVVGGLAATPTGPATLTVNIGPGSIYRQMPADATAYSDLGVDSTVIVKQGIVNVTTPFAFAAPGTPGQSINYLVQATSADTDNTPVVLLYLNPSNPPASYAQPWSGPNNSGQAQNTIRSCSCVLTVKAGTAAATGTQTTPAPDANNVGLWVITVAQGQTQITAGSIVQFSPSPFITPISSVSTLVAFRMPLQIVAPYGSPPAVAATLGDTPMMQFAKANTPGVFFQFPVTSQISLTAPVRLRLQYTTDLSGGNCYMQLGYQVFGSGPFSPASYTNVNEAIAAPGTAGNMVGVQTTTMVIPSGALALGALINCVLTRQGPNGLDTNLGNLQIAQITLEQ